MPLYVMQYFVPQELIIKTEIVHYVNQVHILQNAYLLVLNVLKINTRPLVLHLVHHVRLDLHPLLVVHPVHHVWQEPTSILLLVLVNLVLPTNTRLLDLQLVLRVPLDRFQQQAVRHVQHAQVEQSMIQVPDLVTIVQ